jgi:aminomethyltransferase
MTLKQTPLFDAHVSLQAKMCPFAGYTMPIYYPLGVLKEHEWVRTQAGLFDVSHMGQIILTGADCANFLETITPSALQSLSIQKCKYTVLLNEAKGVLDDCIFTRLYEDQFYAVINAGCKDKDIAWLNNILPHSVRLKHLEDLALLALQGPEAENVLSRLLDLDLSDLPYMAMRMVQFDGVDIKIFRLGYTGEDGFEISCPNQRVHDLWNALLSDDAVKPIGLAARDSLRLEMGYCLYGHELTEEITPFEADLNWILRKDIPRQNPKFIRKGFVLLDKGIAREGADICLASGRVCGLVTSGGFSPTLKKSIGMMRIENSDDLLAHDLYVKVRDQMIAIQIAPLPFVPARTKKLSVSGEKKYVCA